MCHPSLVIIITVFTNVYQVEEHSIDIQNPVWDASLTKLVRTVAFKFGIRPDDLSAKLDMLLYMEKGSSIDWCSNVEEDEKIIGSMLIQLPSIFTGGKISVFDGGEDVDEEDEENFITSFKMGKSNNQAEFACHFVCHYSDCQYKIKEITSGSRVLLRYSLVYNNDGESPTAELLHKTVIPLKTSLTYLPRVDRMIVVPLRQHHPSASLTLNGIDALAPDHRAIAESIRLAGGDNWTILIVNAVNTYTTFSGSDENGQSKIEFAPFRDQQGKTVDRKWMKKILDFSPLGGEMDNRGGGMLLSTSNGLADNWGKRKSRKKKAIHIHDGYDSDSHYGYIYSDYRTSYEYTSTYRATFLLAYDMDSVFELKCAEASRGTSGRIVRNDGVIAAAQEVVEKEDFCLLGRLLDVVEVKDELRLDTSTCCKLLEMIIHSTDNQSVPASLASRILGALSISAEPDSKLWDTIVSTVGKFKWPALHANVSSLLMDESRKKEISYSSPRSRISLEVFLNRVDFCLKLNAAEAGVEANFAPKSISESIKDLASTDKTSIPYGHVLMKKIDSMVATHGWKAMAEVVKHSFEFYSRNTPSSGLDRFVEMGSTVSKLHGNHSCRITLDAITSFAETFSSNMQNFPPYRLLNYCTISNLYAPSMMTSIRVVIEHGKQNAMDSVGTRLISHRNIFSSFLNTAASEVAHNSVEPQTFLLDALNKLFMQQSIDLELACECAASRCECRWKVSPAPDNDATEDNITISPSLHIKMTLDANPNLASMKDKDNRLPLHYAAARGVYETVACVLEANPQAAVISDPVTGLYPFMLAGSNENTAAAFELLLSEPNLVLGGIPEDQDEVESDEANDRKRKRSPSM